MLEFFKPEPDEPSTFPLGVIAQDDWSITYRLLEPRRFHLEKFPEFFLEERERVMRENVLVPSFRRPDNGHMLPIETTDPAFLEAIASRGDAYFRYGPVFEIEGYKADELAELIASEQALTEALVKHGHGSLNRLARALG